MSASKPKSPDQPLEAMDVKKGDLIADSLAPITTTSAPSPNADVVDFFEANSVPYCKKCGQQICTNEFHEPVCPYEAIDCPVVK